MTPLYFYILLGSLVVPAVFSVFYLDFIKKWRNFVSSTLIIAILFLIWDAIFTENRVWGFEESYCLGVYILGMPIEEWLFFLIIPFCSLFSHFALFYKFPDLKIKRTTTIVLTILFFLISVCIAVINFEKAYTFVNFIFLSIFLSLGGLFGIRILQQFYISFLIILIPFFIVNGLLTGIATENPIVWYNNQENLGIRLATIPIEDIGYAFSMLFGNLLLFEKLNKRENEYFV